MPGRALSIWIQQLPRQDALKQIDAIQAITFPLWSDGGKGQMTAGDQKRAAYLHRLQVKAGLIEDDGQYDAEGRKIVKISQLRGVLWETAGLET